MAKPQLGVIHCTATPAGREVTREELARWGRQRGWRQVYGYRGLIHLNGNLEILVPADDDAFIDPWEITNGASGHNHHAIHFAYSGGMSTDNKYPLDTRTAAQRLTLRNIVFDYISRYPWLKWCGHNQLTDKKACPSFSVPEWLRAIGVKPENIYE